MPWTTLKRDCKQSDGKSGSYVVLKKKSGGGTEQVSCHSSEEKAKGSVGARHTNEGRTMKITKRQLKRLIREATGGGKGKGWQLADGRCNSHNISPGEVAEAMSVLEEFGYSLFIPPTVDDNNIVAHRSISNSHAVH